MPITVKTDSSTFRDPAMGPSRPRKARRWGIGIAGFLILYGLLGHFLAPALLRPYAERQLSSTLQRPVTIAVLSLNPYTLNLEADGIRIAERSGSEDFLTLQKLRVRPSWSSLLRLKPIVAELLVDHLQVHVVRTAAQTFNFTDIVEALGTPAEPPKPKPAEPLRYAVSNIRVENAAIDFDDRVLNEQHRIENLRIGIPFIANIPSKTEVFVQPLLEATIDGSTVKLTGIAKPFSPTLESTLAVKLNQLDLPGLLEYSPLPLPVKIAKARLSTDLILQFQRLDGEPHVGISGSVDLDGLSVTERDGQPLFDADSIHLAADAIEPLRPIVHLSALRIEHPLLTLSRDAAGTLNLSRLARPAKPSTQATPAGAPKSPAVLPDFSLSRFQLDDGSIHFSDHATGAGAAAFELRRIGIAVQALSTRARTPATYEIKAELAKGGTLAVNGSLVIPARTLDTRLSLDALALPAFQPYLDSRLAARFDAGTLALKMQARIDAGKAVPAITVGPGTIGVQALKLVTGHGARPLIALGRASVDVTAVDLEKRDADIAAVEVASLQVNAERDRDGAIDLAGLLRPGDKATASSAAAESTGDAAWHYRVGSTRLSDSALHLIDHSNSEPVALSVSSLALTLGALSDDAKQAIPLDLSAHLQGKGRLAVRGTVAREPLKARLKLKASALDLAAVSPYVIGAINARVESARLGLGGDAALSRSDGAGLDLDYKGSAQLSEVRVLDKDNGDAFLGFGDLDLGGIDAHYDAGGPRVDIGRIALSDFFAQVLLDDSGRLNIGRVIATQAPAGGQAAADAAAPAAPQAASAPLKLHIGEIALAAGNVDYTDHFIRPNFNARLTAIKGSIGRFGSDSTESAPLDVSATLNDNGPVEIKGTINPLAPAPTLDLKASAKDIELTRFAAYSAKYTGFPIVKGKLQVDLSYALKDNALSANNHVFIDQFTFGDRVESPDATSLPVRLAISLLKDARGQIDVNVPVSGSLADPKFSLGGVIWKAFLNLIEKAVTAPFSLLARAIGGGSGSGAELDYVAFAPGSATLDDSQKSKLDMLAKALADRPAIKLSLSGHFDTAMDTPALRQDAVARQIRQQKLKDSGGKDKPIDSVSVDPAEYDKYLKRAYEAADIKKPRNFFGFAKSLPPAEMKRRLSDAVTIDKTDLQALAQRRAAAVQSYLATKLDTGRVSVETSKADDAKTGETSGAKPRVDFAVKL